MSFTREQISQRVITVIQNNDFAAEMMSGKAPDVIEAHHLRNDYDHDSLDDVELVMSLEDEFQISIPDEHADKLETVGAVIEYIHNRMNDVAKHV